LEPLIREFGLGEPRDYRVPAGGLHRQHPIGIWQPTAALVVEVLSPSDESWEKLPFYAAHSVDEVLIVDPATHKVDWLTLVDGEYRPIEHSSLVDLGSSRLADQIKWPLID
jgi:Uma2 family endonuclease